MKWKINRYVAGRLIFPVANSSTLLRTQFTNPKSPITSAMRIIEPLFASQ